jgi:hypothetical protein
MASPAGTQGGEGNGAAAGSAGGGGNGAPAGTPAQPAGSSPQGAAAAPSPGTAIPVDVLPEQLRGQPENVIKFTLNKMVESLSATNRRNQELEAELKKRMGSSPPPGQAQPAPAQPEGEKKPAKPLDQWLLEEPEAALDHFVRSRYGNIFTQLDQLNERTGRAELSSVRAEIDDFAEFEGEVDEILTQSNTPKTRENILGAYIMAVGNRTLEEKKRARRAANNPERAAVENPTPEKKYNKTALSEEIRTGLGISEDDYYEKFADSSKLEIKVPT